MRKTTLGQLLVNRALPEDLRDWNRVLDKGGIKQLLQEVAKKHPDKYREVAKALSDVGRDAAYSSGGQSFGLRHLRAAPAAAQMRLRMHKRLSEIYSDPQLSQEAREKKVIQVAAEEQKKLVDDVMKQAKDSGNPLADQVESGARGNAHNLNSLLGADLLYTNHKGDPVAIPVMRSYSQGLRPAEYYAGTFGARKGIIDLQQATADAGYLAKQLRAATHRLLVSEVDDEQEYDEQRPRGLPVSTGDVDSEGALLSKAVGGYKRNTVLTPKILKDLRNQGVEDILVRSPTVGGPADGGIYARDAGVRERGQLAPIGDYAGIAAADALAEPVTQSAISSKHSGGVAGAEAKAIGGFAAINQLAQVPKKFRGGATHTEVDGKVGGIQAAPQGGTFVLVNGKKHYVPQGLELKIKRGDEVEAGDVLSEGLPNPATVVRHKGVGEGRRYFVDVFRDTLHDANVGSDRRNIELLARGLINHVRLTDELTDDSAYVPDDVVPYQTLERAWQAREGTRTMNPSAAKGRYLEKPVLHYTIGTKVRPSVVKRLEQFGVQNVDVHDDEPPFVAEQIRAMSNVQQDPDWMTRMLGGNQEKSLLSGAHRGAVSDASGTSFVAPLAQAKDFGRSGKSKGWDPDYQTQNTGSVLSE